MVLSFLLLHFEFGKLSNSRGFHAKLMCEGLGPPSCVKRHESGECEGQNRNLSAHEVLSRRLRSVLYILTAAVSKLKPGTGGWDKVC